MIDRRPRADKLTKRNMQGDSMNIFKQALGENDSLESVPAQKPKSFERELYKTGYRNNGAERPEGIGQRVWELVEYWIQQGEEIQGYRFPPVWKNNFARELEALVQADWNDKRAPVTKYLRLDRKLLPADGEYVAGFTAVLRYMVKFFWENILVGDGPSNYNLLFLHDRWYDLQHRAVTRVWADHAKGRWERLTDAQKRARTTYLSDLLKTGQEASQRQQEATRIKRERAERENQEALARIVVNEDGELDYVEEELAEDGEG